MATIGYARVSTDQQSLAMQIDALTPICDKLFQEKQSGGKRDREELNKALVTLQDGDTLVVYKLDRLGRSLKDLIKIIDELKQRNVSFRSVTENIDTSTAMGKCFFHIIAAISEMERDLIKERTVAGLEAARRMGRVGGRHKALNADQIKHAQELVAQGKSKVEIAKLLKVGRATLYRLLEDDAA